MGDKISKTEIAKVLDRPYTTILRWFSQGTKDYKQYCKQVYDQCMKSKAKRASTSIGQVPPVFSPSDSGVKTNGEMISIPKGDYERMIHKLDLLLAQTSELAKLVRMVNNNFVAIKGGGEGFVRRIFK